MYNQFIYDLQARDVYTYYKPKQNPKINPIL